MKIANILQCCHSDIDSLCNATLFLPAGIFVLKSIFTGKKYIDFFGELNNQKSVIKQV